MLLEAQRRGHRLFYLEQGDLALRDGEPWARLAALTVRDDAAGWFTLEEPQWRDLREIDVVLMRKDPPVDAQFIYDTMVLEAAQRAGVTGGQRPAGPARLQREAVRPAFPAMHGAHPGVARRRRNARASWPNMARWC